MKKIVIILTIILFTSLATKSYGQKNRTSDNKIPSNRKETFSLFLNFTTKPGIDWFPEQQFQQVNTGELTSDTSFGWYYYYINEAVHYCIETIFWGMLEELDWS